MFCIFCGKEIRDRSAFCIYCGRTLPSEKRPENRRPDTPTVSHRTPEKIIPHREEKIVLFLSRL